MVYAIFIFQNCICYNYPFESYFRFPCPWNFPWHCARRHSSTLPAQLLLIVCFIVRHKSFTCLFFGHAVSLYYAHLFIFLTHRTKCVPYLSTVIMLPHYEPEPIPRWTARTPKNMTGSLITAGNTTDDSYIYVQVISQPLHNVLI
jgi:hypothetical protein